MRIIILNGLEVNARLCCQYRIAYVCDQVSSWTIGGGRYADRSASQLSCNPEFLIRVETKTSQHIDLHCGLLR